MIHKLHVCVMGAGVVGVTSAYQLLAAGHQVTLLDTMPQPGSGTSYGNGAQLSYSYVAPLADPSIWTQWPQYLFSQTSPLTLRPQLDPDQWRWLLRFLAACTAKQARQTTVELLHLAFYSRERLAEIRNKTNIDFLHRIAGKLVLFSDEATLRSAEKQAEFQAQHGSLQAVLDVRRCLEFEPALAASRRKWVGGIYTNSEEVGDCALFCRGLVNAMSAAGEFRFLPSTRVSKLDIKNNALHSVKTNAGSIEADAFVLALGPDSTRIARSAGLSLPVYPLKGYSITVPLLAGTDASAAVAPSVSITDSTRKIVYARLGDRLRVAGRVELVGMDARIPPRAVKELIDAVSETFPHCADLSNPAMLSPWTGFRPATPSGLPIISAAPVKNLYLNVGHGSLGWTLACGSAALIADIITGRQTSIDARPYQYFE